MQNHLPIIFDLVFTAIEGINSSQSLVLLKALHDLLHRPSFLCLIFFQPNMTPEMTNGSVEMPGLFCKRGRWTPGVPFILEKSCTISDTRIAARNYSTRALPTHLAYWPQLACRPPRLVSSPAAAPPAVDAPQLPSPQVPGRQASPLMQCIVQNYAEHKICGVYIHAEYKIMHGATL